MSVSRRNMHPLGQRLGCCQWPGPMCNTSTAETYSAIGPISSHDAMLVDIGVFVARNVDELEGPPTRSKQLLYDFMLPSRVTLEAIGNNDREAVSWQRPHVQGILSIKSLLGSIFIYHLNTTNPAQVSCNSTSSKTASRNPAVPLHSSNHESPRSPSTCFHALSLHPSPASHC